MRGREISGGFDKAEQKKFHNLLKLAAESPYEGEREAALAAAKRLVKKHGMSLQEAAAQGEREAEEEAAAQRPRRDDFWTRAGARGWNGRGFEPPPGFEERWGQAGEKGERGWRREGFRNPDDDKRQWNKAYAEAQRRGYDPDADRPKPKPRRPNNQPKSTRRMNPYAHARALLAETSLPLKEIAHITRLSIYQVVSLKLKMRNEKQRGRRGAHRARA